MIKRRRFKQELSLRDRLALFAKAARKRLWHSRPGPSEMNCSQGQTSRYDGSFDRLGQFPRAQPPK